MQWRAQVEPPSEEMWNPEVEGWGQFKSTLPSSRWSGLRGSETIGVSVTSLPPSEACVGGSTQGAGEQDSPAGPLWVALCPSVEIHSPATIARIATIRYAVVKFTRTHFSRMPPTTSCMSTPLLLSIQAAMKLFGPSQVLPV